MKNSELIERRPIERLKGLDPQISGLSRARRFLREVSAFAREGAESENLAVTKLALQLLAKSIPDVNYFLGLCGEAI